MSSISFFEEIHDIYVYCHQPQRYTFYENHLLSAMSWFIFLADSGNAAMAWTSRSKGK
jgi:hypothetical protein